jgi:hexosaminidase
VRVNLLRAGASRIWRGAPSALAATVALGASGAGVASADPVESHHIGVIPPWIGRSVSPHPLKGEVPPPTSCTSTLTGTVNKGLVVPAGQWYCLNGADVNGPTWVRPGGGITIEGSTLNGGLRSFGAVNVRVCTSTVNGPTTVLGGSGTIMIGDAGDDGSTDCVGNTLHGPVTIIGNLASVELGADWITGPVTVIGNKGVAFEGSIVGAEIELNQISGPLTCHCNSPTPTNDGDKNTVSGPELGQCAGF